MTITQEQISNIARKLWKLKSKNEQRLLNDTNSILSYIDLLNEVDTNWVEPTVSVIKSTSTLKNDEEKRDISPKDLLACSSCKVIANQIAISDIMK